MSRKIAQLSLLKKEKLAFGGDLMNTRKGRLGYRPLSTKNSIHLVLRSSKAKGSWSMTLPKNRKAIDLIVKKFASKYGVRIHSLANVGNHLHFHLQLSSRYTYKQFIRAITSAIAMAVTGRNRWTKEKSKLKFWDYRPFTRVVAAGLRSLLALKDYVRINQLEGYGVQRQIAEFIIKTRRPPS